MTPLEIRIELLKKNIGYADIARSCGVSRQLVRYAISSPAVYKDTKIIEIKRNIARTLNRPVEKLWLKNNKNNKKNPRTTLGSGQPRTT